MASISPIVAGVDQKLLSKLVLCEEFDIDFNKIHELDINKVRFAEEYTQFLEEKLYNFSKNIINEYVKEDNSLLYKKIKDVINEKLYYIEENSEIYLCWNFKDNFIINKINVEDYCFDDDN